jgi:hypothetical protein
VPGGRFLLRPGNGRRRALEYPALGLCPLPHKLRRRWRALLAVARPSPGLHRPRALFRVPRQPMGPPGMDRIAVAVDPEPFQHPG